MKGRSARKEELVGTIGLLLLKGGDVD